jgi:hypothetical protein
MQPDRSKVTHPRLHAQSDDVCTDQIEWQCSDLQLLPGEKVLQCETKPCTWRICSQETFAEPADMRDSKNGHARSWVHESEFVCLTLYATSKSSTTVQSLPLNSSPLHRHFQNRSGGYALEQSASNVRPFVDRSRVHTESDEEGKKTLFTYCAVSVGVTIRFTGMSDETT